MAQYQVPQFIDVEDKIFGPLSAKQFFYLLGGAALIFILYVFLQLWAVIILGVPIAALTFALAFLKIKGIPFVTVAQNALSHASKQKIYIWKPIRRVGGTPPEGKPALEETPLAPKLSHSKLQDLAWSLDIKQKIRGQEK